jgi:hypothetical protein
MKKYLVMLTIIALIGAVGYVGYAADSSSVAKPTAVAIPDRFAGSVNLYGKMPRTTQVTIDNTSRTIDNLVVTAGGVYLGGSDNTLTPIGVTISCDNATRWSFNTDASTTVGHIIPASGSVNFFGPDAIAYLKGANSVDGTGASCAVTRWH